MRVIGNNLHGLIHYLEGQFTVTLEGVTKAAQWLCENEFEVYQLLDDQVQIRMNLEQVRKLGELIYNDAYHIAHKGANNEAYYWNLDSQYFTIVYTPLTTEQVKEIDKLLL